MLRRARFPPSPFSPSCPPLLQDWLGSVKQSASYSTMRRRILSKSPADLHLASRGPDKASLRMSIKLSIGRIPTTGKLSFSCSPIAFLPFVAAAHECLRFSGSNDVCSPTLYLTSSVVFHLLGVADSTFCPRKAGTGNLPSLVVSSASHNAHNASHSSPRSLPSRCEGDSQGIPTDTQRQLCHLQRRVFETTLTYLCLAFAVSLMLICVKPKRRRCADLVSSGKIPDRQGVAKPSPLLCIFTHARASLATLLFLLPSILLTLLPPASSDTSVWSSVWWQSSPSPK